MGAVCWTGAEFHDPSRYKLIAVSCEQMVGTNRDCMHTSFYIVATNIFQLLQGRCRKLPHNSLKHANVEAVYGLSDNRLFNPILCLRIAVDLRWRGLLARGGLFCANLNWRRIFCE